MQITIKCASFSGTMDMEEKVVALKEDFQNKEDLPLSFIKDREIEDNNGFAFSVPRLQRVLEEVGQEQQLTLGIKQQRPHPSCIEESYLPNQCVRGLRIPNYMSFVSLHESHVQRCLDLVEARASNSLSLICNTTSLFNIPVNLRSSKREFLFDSIKTRRRRTQSTSDLSKFAVECTSATGPGNVIISPVAIGHRIFNSTERSEKVRSLLRSPLSCHLGSVDTNRSLGKVMSAAVKDIKGSELVNSPPRLQISFPQKPVGDNMPIQKQRYPPEASDKMLVSCLSTNSTSSYQSSSSSCSPAFKGFLHCTWKGGTPNFVFSVDDQGEVYTASPCKVESLGTKAPDYMYFFHSITDGKKTQRSCGDTLSNLVGTMKVSSYLTLNSNSLKFMETEFVLFGSNEYHFEDMQSSSHTFRKKKGLPKKVVDILRPNHSAKHKSSPKFGILGSKFEGFSQKPCLDMLGEHDDLGKEKIVQDHLSTNLELAAIVVKDYNHGNSQNVAAGGWGLKFLEKVTIDCCDNSLVSFSSENCGESCLRNKSESVTGVSVLIPAGIHGGPRTRNGGPSSLTERWRSGGHCDCGGWDIGCPLTVLNNSSSNPKILPQADTQEDCKSFALFLRGAKEGVPTLKIVNIHEGLYFVHFQSTLTPLQSFSIAVAIIHAQSPALCPKKHGLPRVCLYT
ncbi:uncharacterized protein LOC143860396 isoform X2 [Tasmannia lanceolata]|uniref:uncharacterized protein LOC143860396 isoform X2 n=1 Tax=Tasmannia lanceolata TaxID=3420 RepID=UPI00406356D3